MSKRILGFGSYDVASHPRILVLFEGLRACGDEVVELNAPLGIGTAGRVAALKDPLKAARFVVTVLRRWATLAKGSFRFRGRNAPDYVLVGYLGHFDVLLARALFPRTKILLDMLVFAEDTAKDRRAGGRFKNVVLRLIDHNAMRAADTVIIDTPGEITLVPQGFKDRTVVVPVGASNEWFEAGRGRLDFKGGFEREPSIVFFGLFTPLQGTRVIAEALRRIDEDGVCAQVTLVGDGQDAPLCRQLLKGLKGNIKLTWHKWMPPSELIKLVGSHDICLGIFGDDSKARRVVPNKVYQGMAAGCAVVTSDTVVQRKMLGDAAHYVPAGDSEALAETLETLISMPDLLSAAKREAYARAVEAFRPSEIAESLEQVIS
jgi:glycosyltransferase involved in cell wall biosynthesis